MYEKIEKYTVNYLEPRWGEILGEWKDDIHDLKTRVLIDGATFQIVEAEAIGSGVPFEICHKGMDKIKDIIGESIGPGFSKAVRTKLQGPGGCTHVGELMLGSVKAFIQAASRQTPEWVDQEYYESRWKEWLNYYSDQCIYFSQPNISREDIVNAIKTKSQG